MEKLAVGEKYLAIKLAGHNIVSAFKNKTKSGNQPDFKGDGVAVWITTKKEQQTTTQRVKEEDIL